VVLEEAERYAKGLASAIKETMPHGWGFVLLLADLGPTGNLTYLSSINRDDAIRLLGEWVRTVRPGGPADPAKAEWFELLEDRCQCCDSRIDVRAIFGPLRRACVCRSCLAAAGYREEQPGEREES